MKAILVETTQSPISSPLFEHERRIEANGVHLLTTVLWFGVAYVVLGWLRKVYLKKREGDSDDPVLVHRLGLQE